MSFSKPKKTETKYRATDLTPEARLVYTIACKIMKDNGFELVKIRQEFSKHGVQVSERSQVRYLHDFRHSGQILSDSKQSGRPPLLSSEEIEILIGWIINQLDYNWEVHLQDVLNFVDQEFDRTMSKATAGKYLKNAGFSVREAKTKKEGYKLNATQLATLTLDFLKSLSDKDFYNTPRHLLLSIDWTYTSHRTMRSFTFSPTGGDQPKSQDSITRFTNVIFTGFYANGTQVPCICFTANPKFDRLRNQTLIRKKDTDWLDQCLRTYGVHPDRIVYVKPQSSTTTFTRESVELLKLVFEKISIRKGTRVLSDGGGCFSDSLERYGFLSHDKYPSTVHARLSVNDNDCHGWAKQKWNTDYSKIFDDDVESTISLMSIMNSIPKEHIKDLWDKNLLMKVRTPTVEDCLSIVGNVNYKTYGFHQDCLKRYRIYMGIDQRGEVPDAPQGLECRLDGSYWNN
jgi:transposase